MENFKMTSKSNSRSSTASASESFCSQISDSFKSLVEKHNYPAHYDEFATSYICREIPLPLQGKQITTAAITTEEEDAESKIDCPFQSSAVLIAEFGDKRNLYGKSARAKYLIPSSRIIWNQIYGAKDHKFKSKEERTTFLYLKARQWCEVTKALVVDQKLPKIDKRILVKKSSYHQKAAKDANSKTQTSEATSEDNHNSEEDKILENEYIHIRDTISKILGDQAPLQFEADDEIPWQYKALPKRDLRQPIKPKKKPHWRKNVYPPKSEGMRIRDMRKLLPPPKPPHLQTDQLSGIWDPNLMIPEFRAHGLNYDGSQPIGGEEEAPGKPIDWYELEYVLEKCWDWLSSDNNEF